LEDGDVREGETTHEASHFPKERFLYFLGLWDYEWRKQVAAQWSQPYMQQIQRELDRLEGRVEAFQ